jgi:hypothetical protein
MSPDRSQDSDKEIHSPEHPKETENLLVSIWFLLADRIAPSLCCRYPSSLQTAFLAAVRQVSHKDGDLDLAVQYLHDIIVDAPPESMVFMQAGQLLNVIEWRRRYHPGWFPPGSRGTWFKPGHCAEYISRAMVLLQTGADETALDLTTRILNDPSADLGDVGLARLIRAVLFICTGEIDSGETEIIRIRSESL